MTQQEQALADDKMRAEIALALEQAAKTRVEVEKVLRETKKIARETFWYPVFISTGLIGAIGTVSLLLLNALTNQ